MEEKIIAIRNIEKRLDVAISKMNEVNAPIHEILISIDNMSILKGSKNVVMQVGNPPKYKGFTINTFLKGEQINDCDFVIR